MEKKQKEIKKDDYTIGAELRKIQRLPLNILCRQLGVSLQTSKLIQTLIADFLEEK